ncbi:MAG: hypothetical protein HC895_11900 [Leptolyngbyaceae cyanobacterium SM1_3_5]|nr:hypothetical protein [Leptolyngbyaceae cyanobacterium SM1_3_5]
MVAEAIAAELDAPLLSANFAAILAEADVEQTLKLLFREAWLAKAVLYLDLEALLQLHQPQFLKELQNAPGVTIVAGSLPWNLTGQDPIALITVPFPRPDFEQRRGCWEAALAAAEIAIDPPRLSALADRFLQRRIEREQRVEAADGDPLRVFHVFSGDFWLPRKTWSREKEPCLSGLRAYATGFRRYPL